MPSIISYQKHIDALRTIELALPHDGPTPLGQELCAIGDVTYVSLPDDVTLPDQPDEIAATVEVVTLTPELREAIKTSSPLTRLIAQLVIDKIREKYPLDEELYFARIAVGALQQTYTLQDGEAEALAQYQADVEASREWGRVERAKLGL